MATTTMTPVTGTHVWLDAAGVAWIENTNVKVMEVVLDKISYGWSAEEMHYQHPHLSLAQIHAALSYYHDHKEGFDEQIRHDDAEIAALRAEVEAVAPPLRERLLERWRDAGGQQR